MAYTSNTKLHYISAFQQLANSNIHVAVPVKESTNGMADLWSSDSEDEVDMYAPSEERDRIYMIVLSADEFLGVSFYSMDIIMGKLKTPLDLLLSAD